LHQKRVSALGQKGRNVRWSRQTTLTLETTAMEMVLDRDVVTKGH